MQILLLTTELILMKMMTAGMEICFMMICGTMPMRNGNGQTNKCHTAFYREDVG